MLILLTSVLVLGSCNASEESGSLDAAPDDAISSTTVATKITSTAETTTSSTASTTVKSRCASVTPDWAPPGLTMEDYCAMTSLISIQLESDFPDATADLDTGFITFSTEGKSVAQLDMHGLLGAMSDSDNWNDAIDTYLEIVTDITNQDIVPGTQEWLSSLRVLIYDAEYGGALNPDPAWTELAPGLQVAIVSDTETAVKIVQRRELEIANLGYDDAFEIAIQQTHANEFARINEDFVTVVTGETSDAAFYSASSLLGPTDLFDESGSLGTLVIIANRGTTVLLDLEGSSGGDVSLAIETVILAASNSYQDFINEPGSVTPNMLWWFDGEFYIVEVTEASIQMPDRLLALLG